MQFKAIEMLFSESFWSESYQRDIPGGKTVLLLIIFRFAAFLNLTMRSEFSVVACLTRFELLRKNVFFCEAVQTESDLLRIENSDSER